MTKQRSLLAEFEREYAQFVQDGGIDSGRLWKLGGYARDMADQAGGEHRLLAYVLRSTLFDLAERLVDVPITPGKADLILLALTTPVRAATAALKGPISADQAVRLADRLLDARNVALRQPHG